MKVMERMGWSEGKGLGRDLHGSVKHIGVRMKKDNRGTWKSLLARTGTHAVGARHDPTGIGAQNDVDYNWLETQDMYSSMLTDLNEKLGQPTSGGVSGEAFAAAAAAAATAEPSKPKRGTRAAMFYGRFKRSKDLSGYTDADMNQVLGMAEVRPDRIVAKNAPPEPTRTTAEVEVNDTGFKTITSTLSIADYFKQKMAAVGGGSAAASAAASTAVSTAHNSGDSDSDSDAEPATARPGFGAAALAFVPAVEAAAVAAALAACSDDDDTDSDSAPPKKAKKAKKDKKAKKEKKEKKGKDGRKRSHSGDDSDGEKPKKKAKKAKN